MRFVLDFVFSKKILLVFLFLLILFGVYICFFQLGKAPLDNWDEAWYGELTKQMLRSKNFIIPLWNGAPFFEKPPLYMWFSSFFSLFFGLNEFSLRLTSAISGIIMIAGLTIFLYRKYGFISALAGFATLALNNVFIWRVRSGNLDALVGLFVFFSYFLILSKSKKRFPFLGIVFGLLYLTKGIFVLFPVSLFLLHDVLFRRNTIRKNLKNYLKLLLIAILIPGIWLYIGYKMAGMLFLKSYLFNSDQGETQVSLTNFKFDYIMYTYYSLQRRYFYVLILGFFLMLGKLKKPAYFLLVLFPVTLLLFLSFGEKKNDWYLVPVMPFWSMIIAYAFFQIIRFFRKSLFVKAFLLIIIVFLSFKTYTINIIPILNTTSARGEEASGKYLDKHANPNDKIVRLDQLYPSTVYYSNRIVYSSLPKYTTQGVWISRDDLKKVVKVKNQRWIVGNRSAVKDFMKDFPDYDSTIIPMNGEETVVKMYE